MRFSFFFVFAVVLALDQLTKFLALRYLGGDGSLPLFPNKFHLTLVRNTGIAFGFFREHSAALFILISVSLLFLFLWGCRKTDLPPIQRFALAMILGGAAGNWIDRLRFGAVIDFLDFRIWPVFNIADSAITVGVAVFAFFLILRKER